VTPSQALTSLHGPLAEQGIRTAGMSFGHQDGVLMPHAGDVIGYACGMFWWPAGRLRRGRPVYTIHPAADPDGAARRIAQARQAQPGAVSHDEQPADGSGGQREQGVTHQTTMSIPVTRQ